MGTLQAGRQAGRCSPVTQGRRTGPAMPGKGALQAELVAAADLALSLIE